MRNLLAILCIAFGMASWIAVVGVWVELPLLVQVMPEGWSLPAKMSIILQSANVVPFALAMLRTYRREWVNYELVNYVVLILGWLACSWLSHYWDHASVDGTTSTAFFILFFFMAIVDCTSSVSFTPFMARLEPFFLAYYFIGEGCSGAVPALLGAVQGVGAQHCINGTVFTEPPRYGVNAFFIALAAMAMTSLIAFWAINGYRGFRCHFVSETDEKEYDTVKQENQEGHIDKAIMLPFIVQFIACFLSNGFLPSISTYYSMPYGLQTYHISTILITLANPLAAIILTRINVNQKQQYLLLTFACILAGLLVATAIGSPCPYLVDTMLGSSLNVTISSLFMFLVTCVKISVASQLRATHASRANSLLLWYGAITQLGSLIGALSAYPIVQNGMLTQRYPCHVC